MKLCFIADGRSTHAQRWVAYFAGRHEVHLITYDSMGKRIAGVTEHVVGSPVQNLYLSFWPRHLQVVRLIRRIRPDLVHAHFITKYGFHLLFLKVRPTVVSAWGDDVLILPQQSRTISFFTRFVLRHVDMIYAVSHDIEKHIVNDFDIVEDRIRYMPFGVDTDEFVPSSSPNRDPSRIVVFCNRRFFPVYDMGTLIRGFHMAYQRDERLRLVLKSDGPEQSPMVELVHSLGIDDVVAFEERSDLADVHLDYRQVDIFVSTALSDGTPVSLLEAMASGLPCIATDVGGVPEWISDGKNGLLIPPRDPQILADRLLMLAADPEMRAEFGDLARKQVLERGEWSHLMARAEKDYEELVALQKEDR